MSSTEVGEVAKEIPESDSQIDEDFLWVVFWLEVGEVDEGFADVTIAATGDDAAGVAGMTAMAGAGFALLSFPRGRRKDGRIHLYPNPYEYHHWLPNPAALAEKQGELVLQWWWKMYSWMWTMMGRHQE